MGFKEWMVGLGVMTAGVGAVETLKPEPIVASAEETPTGENRTQKLTVEDKGFEEVQAEKKLLNEDVEKIQNLNVSDGTKEEVVAHLKFMMNKFDSESRDPNLKEIAEVGKTAVESKLKEVLF